MDHMVVPKLHYLTFSLHTFEIQKSNSVLPTKNSRAILCSYFQRPGKGSALKKSSMGMGYNNCALFISICVNRDCKQLATTGQKEIKLHIHIMVSESSKELITLICYKLFVQQLKNF